MTGSFTRRARIAYYLAWVPMAGLVAVLMNLRGHPWWEAAALALPLSGLTGRRGSNVAGWVLLTVLLVANDQKSWLRSHGFEVSDVVESGFAGEGLGFQMCSDVRILRCRLSRNTGTEKSWSTSRSS